MWNVAVPVLTLVPFSRVLAVTPISSQYGGGASSGSIDVSPNPMEWFSQIESKKSPDIVFLATFPYNSPLSGLLSKVAEFIPSIFSTLPSPCALLWLTMIHSTQWLCRRPSLIPYVLRVRKWQPLVVLHPYILVTIHLSAILNYSRESPSS